MDKNEQKKLTKLLFSILGRQPHTFSLLLDADGWCDYKKLFRVVREDADFSYITPRFMEQFFSLYRPEGFEWSEDAVRVKPELCAFEPDYFQACEPPTHLFIAIRPKLHAHVLSNGILPKNTKTWLLLCADKEKAIAIGRRMDKEPLLIEILAQKAYASGIGFKRYGEDFYLAEYIPVEWLVIPPIPPLKEGRKSSTSKKISQQPASENKQSQDEIGSFMLTPLENKQNHATIRKKGEKHYRDNEPSWKDARRNTRRR